MNTVQAWQRYITQLVDPLEFKYGASYDFDGRLDMWQANAVKTALARSGYIAPSVAAKEWATDDLITEALAIYEEWKRDFEGFSLTNKEDYRDYVWILKEIIKSTLAKRYNLQLEQ